MVGSRPITTDKARTRFHSFRLQPREHVFRQIPLGLPSQIKVRDSEPLHLARLHLDPLCDLPLGEDLVRMRWLHVSLHEWCEGGRDKTHNVGFSEAGRWTEFSE